MLTGFSDGQEDEFQDRGIGQLVSLVRIEQSKKMLIPLLLVLTGFQGIECGENNDLISKTLDLSFIGIDLNQIFDRLLSPRGIVNQFATSVSLQVFQSVGYLISG